MVGDTLRWWKSTRSGSSGGACVEVATDHARWYVRDSKDRAAGILSVTPASWSAFVRLVQTAH